jgi:hypothetical protein
MPRPKKCGVKDLIAQKNLIITTTTKWLYMKLAQNAYIMHDKPQKESKNKNTLIYTTLCVLVY